MIRSLYYAPSQLIHKDLPPEKFSELIKNEQAILWVDFASEPAEVCLPLLEGFGFHPLAIDDALQETHEPRLDDWGQYLYIVLKHMSLRPMGDTWETQVDELNVFLGKNYIVTHHSHRILAVDETWFACDRDERKLQEGTDHLLYIIADNLMSGYMPAVKEIDSAIHQIEAEVFDRPSSQTRERLFGLKNILLAMRNNILLPQLEVLHRLAGNDYKMIDPTDRDFFRHMYDRTDKIQNQFLRLENEANRVLSLQPSNTQPFLTKLTHAVRKRAEPPSSFQSSTHDAANSVQAKASYEEGSIFISYRRADSNDVTGRIYDKLVSHFGEEAVFKDVDNIWLGSNFVHDLERALGTCKVVLAIIGKQWVTIAEEDGSRRLDNAEDFVRVEIETSLAQRKPIIPVLVQGAEMPSKQDLPPSLARLTYHNGLLVRPDPDFHNDIRRLISHMEKWLKK